MPATRAPFRVTRGLAVACVGGCLALAGHGVAAGGPPALTPFLVLVLVLLAAGLVVASSRQWTRGRLVVALVAVSVSVHLTVWLDSGEGQVDPRLTARATTSPLHTHAHAHSSWSASMWGAHVVAVVVAALLLARVDSVVAVLVELARGRVVPRPIVDLPSRVVARWVSIGDGPTLALREASTLSRRGPPQVLASG